MNRYEIHFKAMGTRCQISVYADTEANARRAVEPALADTARLEAKYSRYLPSSYLSTINAAAQRGGELEVDEETAALLDYAQQCHAQSDGLFDITSGLLRRAWNFQPEGQTALPSANLLAELLQRVGWEKLSWDSQRLRFAVKGMELDFGGIVKEYAADRAVGLLAANGVSALINLGGDIAVTGPPPAEKGWRIGISDPQAPTDALASLVLAHGSVASSGSYARAIEIDGVRYGHLLNPFTGYPLGAMLAASVVADHCTVAGSLATIALCKGDDAVAFLESTGQPHLLVDSASGVVNRL